MFYLFGLLFSHGSDFLRAVASSVLISNQQQHKLACSHIHFTCKVNEPHYAVNPKLCVTVEGIEDVHVACDVHVCQFYLILSRETELSSQKKNWNKIKQDYCTLRRQNFLYDSLQEVCFMLSVEASINK